MGMNEQIDPQILSQEQQTLDCTRMAWKQEYQKRVTEPSLASRSLSLNRHEYRAQQLARRHRLDDLDRLAGDPMYYRRVDMRLDDGQIERLYISKRCHYLWDWAEHDGAKIISFLSDLARDLIGEPPATITYDDGTWHIGLTRDLSIRADYVTGYRDVRSADDGLRTPWADVVIQRMRERVTTHEARDILETIAAEQRDTVFQPWFPTLIIEGGPGTGKTQVGILRLVRALSDPDATPHHRTVLWLMPSQAFRDYFTPMIEREFGVTTLHAMTPQEWFVRQTGINPQDLSDIPAPARQTPEWLFWLTDGLASWRDRQAQRLCQEFTRVETVYDKEYRARYQFVVSDTMLLQAVHDAQNTPPGRWKRHVFDSLIKQVQEAILPHFRNNPDERRLQLAQVILNKRAAEWAVEWNVVDYYRQRLNAWDPQAILSYDDLPALVWLSTQTGAVHPVIPSDAVIIEEAQTLTPMMYQALRSLYPRAAWTLVGDLDQRPNDRLGLTAWSDAMPSNTSSHIVQLTTNYRSTPAIVAVLNGLRKQWDPTRASLVGLAWDDTPVAGWVLQDDRAQEHRVLQWAYSHHAASRRALVVVPDADSLAIWAELFRTSAIPSSRIAPGSPWRDQTIGVSTPEHAQGLESDHVWIVSADKSHYPQSVLHRAERLVPVAQDHSAIRRLYLAASRAMRTLTFSAVEQPAPALSPLPIQWHH